MKSPSLGFATILGNLPSAQLTNEPRTVLLKSEEPSNTMLRAGAKSAKLSKGESEQCVYGFIDLFANLCPVKSQDVEEIPGTRMPQPTLMKQKPGAVLIDNSLELLQTQTFPLIAGAKMALKSNAPVESPQAQPLSGIVETDGKSAVLVQDTITPISLAMGQAQDPPRPHNAMIENEIVAERIPTISIARPEGTIDGRPFQMVQAEKTMPDVMLRGQADNDNHFRIARAEKIILTGSDFETGMAKSGLTETVNVMAQDGSSKNPGVFEPANNDPSMVKTPVTQSDVDGLALRATLSSGTETPKPREFDNPLPTQGVARLTAARKLTDDGLLHADPVELVEPNEPSSGTKVFAKPSSESHPLKSPLVVHQATDAFEQIKKGWPDLKTATADDALTNVDAGLSNRMVVENTSSLTNNDSPQLQFDTEQPVHSLKQMVRRMSLSAAAGQNRMQIQLKPEMLGGLKIDILSENRQVAIRMTAESALVKDIIEQNLQVLKTEFGHHGLEIVKFDVFVQNNAEGWNANQQFTHFNTSQHQTPNQSQAQFDEKLENTEGGDLMQNNDEVKEQSEETDGIDFFA